MAYNHQQIINEIDNIKHDELSIVWTCEQIIIPDTFQFTHRNIIINDYGNPVLKIYIGETKLLYKNLYYHESKVPWNHSGESQSMVDVLDNNDNILFSFDNSKKEITAINVGTGVLKSKDVNNYFDLSVYNDMDIADKDLIVIVEETPKIIDVKWNCSNPLYMSLDSEVKIDFLLTYSNGDKRTYIKESYIQSLRNTNKYFVNVLDTGYFKSTSEPGISYIIFNSELLGELTPPVLKIIVCNNDNLIPESAYSSFIHNENIVLPIHEQTQLEFWERIMDENNNILFEYDRLQPVDGKLSIIEGDAIQLKDRTVTGVNISTSRLDYFSNKINLEWYDYRVDWSVNVVKEVKEVTWSILRHEFNVGDNVQITVILHYTDGTFEDITHTCSFSYDDRYIQVENGIITGIGPGNTVIKILESTVPESIDLPDEIMLTIIQPITKMYLDKYKLEMIIGEEEQLDFNYEPSNATPIELKWHSTEPNVVSVDNNGHIKALSRGTAEIIISEYIETGDMDVIPDTGEITHKQSIYLSDDLDILAVTNNEGIAEIKLLDSTLYKVEIKDKTSKLKDIKVNFKSDNGHKIYLSLPSTIDTSYGHDIYVTVSNFYNELVKGIEVIGYLLDESDHVKDSISSKTDIHGNCTLCSLNKTVTDEKGVAILDGLRIEIEHNNAYVKNASINHSNRNRLIITSDIKLSDIEVMKKLQISIMKDEQDEQFRSPIGDIHVNVYVENQLLYSDYPDLDGKIIIDSNITIEDTFIVDSEDIFEEEIQNETLNLMIYDPTKCAVCTVNCKAIEVTDVLFDIHTITLDKDKYETFDPIAKIEPENATYKDISYVIEDLNVARINSNGEVYGYKVGKTKLIAISKDNPSKKAEVELIIVSHKVEKVTITTDENDNDYEWYDHLNLRIELAGEHGERVTKEKYDDDDFKRFYLPVNNSMQLNAIIEPEDANDTNVTWLSSNSQLVKVSKDGVVTALRENIRKDLDVYGDDDISETRFANTVWITALNKKYKKYDICQVRVTQNNIIDIEVPVPDEHDKDADDISVVDGKYDVNSEHEKDYVINVGETIEVPINLTVQDSNFGPSNYIRWYINEDSSDILDIWGGTPNHKNASDEEFDWSAVTPEQVNNDKLTPTLYVTGNAIGDAFIYGKTYVKANRDINDPQLYIPKDNLTGVSDKSGELVFNYKTIKNDKIKLIFKYHSKSNGVLKGLKQTYINSIKNQLDIVNIAGDGALNVNMNGIEINVMNNGVKRIEEGVSEIIDENRIITHGIPMEGVSAVYTGDNKIYITIPDKLVAKDYATHDVSKLTHTFEYSPVISSEGIDIKILEDIEKYKTDIEDYIEIMIIADNEEVLEKFYRTPIYVNGFYKHNGKIVRKVWGNFATYLSESSITGTSDHTTTLFFPSSKQIDQDITNTFTTNDNPWDAKPGTGTWEYGPRSRRISFRVVATPKKLKVAWCNAYTERFVKFNEIYSPCYRDKWSKNKFRYMMIGHDDEFEDLLSVAELEKRELADKYKAYAWFSDNEKVIRFEDVEDLMYYDEDGNRTNDPNENYEVRASDTVSIDLKNLNAETYDGYNDNDDFIAIKKGENFMKLIDNTLAINNENIAVIRLNIPDDGELLVRHTGNIKYDTVEDMSNKPVVTKYTTTEFHETKIKAKKGDQLFIIGATKSISRVNALQFQYDRGPWIGTPSNHFEKLMTESFIQYKEMVSINVPGGNAYEYATNKGIKLNDNRYSCIKLTPKMDSEITVNFTDNSVRFEGDKTGVVTKSASPHTFEAKAGKTYYIYGENGDAYVTGIDYKYDLGGKHTGSYKGTYHFKVKPSYIKRVICEGVGTANIYIVSPKGQTVANLQIVVE